MADAPGASSRRGEFDHYQAQQAAVDGFVSPWASALYDDDPPPAAGRAVRVARRKACAGIWSIGVQHRAARFRCVPALDDPRGTEPPARAGASDMPDEKSKRLIGGMPDWG
jgi:hypothetical protein